MERSAVFIVPMIQRFLGSVNGVSEYWRDICSARYSNKKYSSPKTHIATVDLVNQQYIPSFRVLQSSQGNPFERSVNELKSTLPIRSAARAIAFYKVLVSI